MTFDERVVLHRVVPQAGSPTLLKLTRWVSGTNPTTLEQEQAPSRQTGEAQSAGDRARGWLIFKAHRLCVSLNSRLESNKEKKRRARAHPARRSRQPRLLPLPLPPLVIRHFPTRPRPPRLGILRGLGRGFVCKGAVFVERGDAVVVVV